MTKEELRKSLDFVNEERDKLQKWVDYYKDHVIEQNKRINKAIEYIEKHRKVYKLGVNQETDEFDYISTSPQVLLNILRGEDK